MIIQKSGYFVLEVLSGTIVSIQITLQPKIIKRIKLKLQKQLSKMIAIKNRIIFKRLHEDINLKRIQLFQLVII